MFAIAITCKCCSLKWYSERGLRSIDGDSLLLSPLKEETSLNLEQAWCGYEDKLVTAYIFLNKIW